MEVSDAGVLLELCSSLNALDSTQMQININKYVSSIFSPLGVNFIAWAVQDPT